MTTQTLNPKNCLPTFSHEAVRRKPALSRIRKFKKFGQVKIGKAAPHPEISGMWEVSAGFIDCRICSIFRTDFKATVQDEPFARSDATRLQLLDALDDDYADPFYVADLLLHYGQVLGDTTWQEVARKLDRTPSTITAYLSVLRCPPLLKPRMAGLSPSIVRLICGMKYRPGMEQAIEFAHTPISGRKPTMREVADSIRDLSAGHHRPRPRRVSIDFNEMPMSFCLQEDYSVRSVTQQLSDFISKLNSVSEPDENAIAALKREFSIKQFSKPRRGF
jgi:hypothetical protein